MSNFPQQQAKTQPSVMDYSSRVNALSKLHRERTGKEENPNRIVVAAKFVGTNDDLMKSDRLVFTQLDNFEFAVGGWLYFRKTIGRMPFYFTKAVRVEHPFDSNGAPVLEVELYDDVDTEFEDQYLADCVRLAGFYDAMLNNHPTWKSTSRAPGSNCPVGPCWVPRDQWLNCSLNLWYSVSPVTHRAIFNFLFPNPADPDTYHESILRNLEATLPNGLFFDSKHEGIVTFAGSGKDCGNISRVRIRTATGDVHVDGPPNSRLRVRPGDKVRPGTVLFQILPAAKAPGRSRNSLETVKATMALYPANSAADCVEAWFDNAAHTGNDLHLLPAWAVKGWLDSGHSVDESSCVVEASEFLRLANASGATQGWTVLPPARIYPEPRDKFNIVTGGLNVRINRISSAEEETAHGVAVQEEVSGAIAAQ